MSNTKHYRSRSYSSKPKKYTKKESSIENRNLIIVLSFITLIVFSVIIYLSGGLSQFLNKI